MFCVVSCRSVLNLLLFSFSSLHSLSIFDLLLFDHPFVIFKHLSLKQQSADYQVALLIHIILIFSQSFFALTLQGCMLSEEATDTNVIVWLNSTGARYPLHHGRAVQNNASVSVSEKTYQHTLL